MTAPVVEDGRCVCCDLPVVFCGLAVDRARRQAVVAERRRLLSLPGVVAAQYAGACGRCGEQLHVGDPIVREGAGWRSLLCCGGAA